MEIHVLCTVTDVSKEHSACISKAEQFKKNNFPEDDDSQKRL